MNRREAISSVALLLGGTIIGSNAFLSGCKPKSEVGVSFSPEDIYLLDEISETILPATSTPGAKEAKVGEFMTVIVRDCYEEKDQTVFMDGIKKLNEACKAKHNGKEFLNASPEQRHELLVALDAEQKEYQKNKKEGEPSHYFRMMKELTLWGYFSSEVGATKALRYVAVPGKYEGCIDYKKGDKAWAT